MHETCWFHTEITHLSEKNRELCNHALTQNLAVLLKPLTNWVTVQPTVVPTGV